MEGVKKLGFMAKSVLLGFTITCLLMAIFAALLAYTNISESTIPGGMMVIEVVSVLFAGIKVARMTQKEGLKNGALIGGIYGILWYLLGSIKTGFQMDLGMIYVLLIRNDCGNGWWHYWGKLKNKEKRLR